MAVLLSYLLIGLIVIVFLAAAIKIMRDDLSRIRAESTNPSTYLYDYEALLLTLEGEIDGALELLNQAVDSGYLSTLRRE